MPKLIVDNIEEELRNGLHAIASAHGLSVEEYVHDLLRNTVLSNGTSPKGLGTRLAERFAENPLEIDIPELRGQTVEPISFDQ